jgi:uncharacterized protein YbjT (DUF2867 family)
LPDRVTDGEAARALQENPMASKPRVLVIGGTGAQGGSVARHLLAEGRCRVRCLTRRLDSVAAVALADAGAEVVEGDMAERESLDAALTGCEAAFGVTDYFEHFDAEYELGAQFLEAVTDSAVEHLVLSTLPSARDLSAGALEVPHFEHKASLEALVRQKEIFATFIHVAFYYENFLLNCPPRRQDNGTFAFGFPLGSAVLSAVAVEDIGGVVAAILRQPAAFHGRTVEIVGDQRPAAEYAAIIGAVTGRTVRYQHIPREVFATLEIPGAKALADMFELYRSHVRADPKHLAESLRLHPGIRSFERWAREHHDALAAAMDD